MVVNRVIGIIICNNDKQNQHGINQCRAFNQSQLEKLPPIDVDPPLTRGMFSTTELEKLAKGWNSQYAIKFEGYEFESKQWDIWLDKFESVLKIIDWKMAHLAVAYDKAPKGQRKRNFSYRWTRDSSNPKEWTFSGGPREFDGDLQLVRSEASFLKGAVRADPSNPEILHRLVTVLSRLREFDDLNNYFKKLKSVDHDRAMHLEASTLKPWAERVGLH